ncbi:DEKNAAC105625 [Brettanomyces naardenensis]|uniref:DEKNAAC105625 n=1 Tax=Brettanomyces naardenensis TaxID=13370 RepID=A0A448YU22_BRENA|nr:DEKNAAC105625 [Brettanomyces naardenensis]
MIRLGIPSKSACIAARRFARFSSSSAPSKNDPLSILSSMTKQDAQRTTRDTASRSDSLFSFLGDPAISSSSIKSKVDAFEFVKDLPLPEKLAGRTLSVRKSANINRSISQFDTLVRSNNIKDLWYDQRFYTKPSKRRLAKKIANKKKRFDSGIAELFQVVKDAVRKGY